MTGATNKEKPRESKNFINLGVILNKKNEVLMIRRMKKETGSDQSVLEWAFPGGKQHYGETRAECVKREVLDETGYDIKPLQEISMRVHPQFLVTVVYHFCGLSSEKQTAEPKEPDEVAEIRWVKPAEIPKLITTDLDPQVAKILGL